MDLWGCARAGWQCFSDLTRKAEALEQVEFAYEVGRQADSAAIDIAQVNRQWSARSHAVDSVHDFQDVVGKDEPIAVGVTRKKPKASPRVAGDVPNASPPIRLNGHVERERLVICARSVGYDNRRRIRWRGERRNLCNLKIVGGVFCVAGRVLKREYHRSKPAPLRR